MCSYPPHGNLIGQKKVVQMVGIHQPMQTMSTPTRKFMTVLKESLAQLKRKSSLTQLLLAATSTKGVTTFPVKPFWHAITTKSQKMFSQQYKNLMATMVMWTIMATLARVSIALTHMAKIAIMDLFMIPLVIALASQKTLMTLSFRT